MPKVAKVRNPSRKVRTRKTTRTEEPVNAWDLIGDSIKMIIYGESATGKTTLWSTFPGKILCLICSGGSRPGELKSIDTPENRKRIDARIITKTDQFKEMIEGADEKYDTVVLDHVSGLEDLDMKEILGLDEIPTTLMWGDATISEFGQNVIHMQTYLKDFFNLNCNSVVIGQEREFTGKESSNKDDEELNKIGCSVRPALGRWLFPTVDYNFRTFNRNRVEVTKKKVGGKLKTIETETDELEYCLRIMKTEGLIIKFRDNKKGEGIPEIIVDPTYDKIMKYINR